MKRKIWRLALALSTTIALGRVAVAFTTPFTFHCTGNACRAVAFLDEGSGCIVITNHSRRPVHITLGIDQVTSDLQPGETFSKLSIHGCYGYYDGGETANFISGPHD